MRPLIVSLLLVLVAAGCLSSTRKLGDLSVGMTRAQVIEILGRPVSVSAAEDGSELMRYELRGAHANDGWPPRKFTGNYTVQLRAGKIVAFGRDDEFRTLRVKQ